MTVTRWTALPALAALLGSAGPLPAGDLYAEKAPARVEAPALPRPADVRALDVRPDAVALRGADDARQLVLTATLPDGRLQDLTGDVKYEVADPKVARVTSAGRVVPLANGSTTVTARYGDRAVT